MADIDDAIAKRLPVEWAKANDPAKRNRSKARNNLRKRYRAMIELEAFKAAHPDAICAGCINSSVHQQLGLVCDADSDFYGYQRVDAGYVCARWDKKS